jgi:pimeloyl-ACP methyl ester carboxylesterase
VETVSRAAPAPAQVIWISPGPGFPVTPSSASVAGELGARAAISQKRLAAWEAAPGEHYDLGVEVEAVAAMARSRGLSRYHLFGFSAGATVALAAALALGADVISVAVLEAAVIGDDDWHPCETAWRADLAAVRDLPPPARGTAFRQLIMGPEEPLPPSLGPPPPWTAKTDMLEDMLALVGFVSRDLAAITRPVLAITGGRSSPRFQHLAERLVGVIPAAEATTFPDCSHLSPPHRAEPARLAAVLLDFWTRAAAP